MKSKTVLTFFATILLTLSTTSYASQQATGGPLLRYQVSPGFSLPEYRNFFICEIYADRVETVKGVSTLSVKASKSIEINGNITEIMNTIAAAEKVHTIGPTDMPSTTYSVSHVEEGSTVSTLLPFDVVGSVTTKTKHYQAKVLKSFIDKVCN